MSRVLTQAVESIHAYPFGWGTGPIASTVQDAVNWWLHQTKSAVDWTSPEVMLTDAEVAQLRAMEPVTGHEWYGLYVPAVAGWNSFWLAEAKKWASSPIVYDVEGKPARDVQGAESLIRSGCKVAGTLSVDWVLFSAAMKKYHANQVATTSITAPSSAFYPTTCTLMSDQVANARSLVLPMAQILHANGIHESDVLFIPQRYPAYFDIARDIGLQQGLLLPEVQKMVKLKYIRGTPAAGATEVESAVAQALNTNPDVHLVAVLSHAYAGASTAIRTAGRKDVWVIAFDLDEGTATQLLHGGWPVAVAYSLPIHQLAVADAHVMGKLLLGKRVPLIVKAEGTVATSANVKEAYAHDWGGQELPWR